MAYDFSSDEEERLQKKLIPLNIVVCILCLVAMISLIFTPLFKFDAHKMGKEMAGVFFEDGSSDDFKDLLENLEGEVSYTPIDIGEFAFSDNVTLEDIIDSALVKTGIIGKAIVPVVNAIAVQTFVDGDTSNKDMSSIEEKFRALGSVHSEAEMYAAAGEWVDAVNAVFPGAISEEEKSAVLDEFVEQYNNTIIATDGSYDIEKFICVFGSDLLDLNKTCTNYSSMLATLLDRDGSITGMLNEMGDIVKMVPKALFGFVMFVAGLWFILFMFSLLHIFARNKRFTMWYVKMIGIYPCLIFGVVPLVMPAIGKLVGGGFAMIAAIIGAISTLTWISGACYILLWGVSIFWAFPIKKKIRRERKY